MLKKGIVIALVAVLSASSALGQTIIRGIVVDSLSNPIPFVQVLLKPSKSSSYAGFTQCNGKGEYRLKVNSGGEYNLEFKAISYRSVVYPLSIIESQREHEITISPTLFAQPVSIKETVVIGERPITIKRDTIIFKALAFTRGDEKVAEDVLKRLPGITVGKDGQILWQGKEVEKVMVEGDDLFGKGYRLISRNMHAHVIDKVEVYERYSHNPLLKDIEYSERVALNLTLKDDVRLTFFGNTSADYTTNNNYSLKGNLMSIGRRDKYYLFGNSNSIGFNPTGDIWHFVSLRDESSNSQPPIVALSPNYLISLRGFYPALKEQRVRDNNSNMLSFNTIIKPTNKITAKFTSFGTFERDKYFNEGYQYYQLPGSTFTNNESHNLHSGANDYFGKLELNYSHANISSMAYEGLVLKETGRSRADHLFNLQPSKEQLNNGTISVNQQISVTHRISPKTALVASARYQFDDRQEQYQVSRFTVEELFPEIENGVGVEQSVGSQLNSGTIAIKEIWRLGEKYIIEARAATFFNSNRLASHLLINRSDNSTTTPGDDFLNNFHFVGSDTYAGLNISKSLNKFIFIALFDFHWVSTQIALGNNALQKEGYPAAEPKLGINWKITDTHIIKAFYAYNTSPATTNEVMGSMVLVGSNRFQQGLGSFVLQQEHTSKLSYTLGRVTDIFQLNTSAILSTSNRAFAQNLQITPTFVITSPSAGNNRTVAILDAKADLFIRPLRSNLKVIGKYIYGSNVSIVNGRTDDVTTQSQSIGGEFRSAFKGAFDYHYGIEWTQQTHSAKASNRITNNYQFLDLFFKFSNSVNASINAERYYFGNITNSNNPWYFVDITLDYTYQPNKLTFSAGVYNIANHKEFGNISITEISEAATLYRIVPRHFKIEVDYRF